MNITHPVTLLTDYILATAALIFGFGMLRIRHRSRAKCLWMVGFFTAAAAAAAGGTFHGFSLYLSESLARILWNSTMSFIGATAGFMISGAITGLPTPPRDKRWLKAGLWLSLGGMAIQQLRLGLHYHFNHADLYHCVQTVGFYCFYRGARGES
jgi:hypothetical protein